jgi:hypothetical protein
MFISQQSFNISKCSTSLSSSDPSSSDLSINDETQISHGKEKKRIFFGTKN